MQHHEVRSGVEFSLCFDRLLWFDEFPSASIDFLNFFFFFFLFHGLEAVPEETRKIRTLYSLV